MTRRSRRQVLTAGLAVLAGTLGDHASARMPRDDEIATLLRTLPDLDSVARLGRRALEQRSTTLAHETAVLRRSLAVRLDHDDVRVRFDSLCASELYADQVVEIGGWRFAASEVRLCVIAALSRTGE